MIIEYFRLDLGGKDSVINILRCFPFLLSLHSRQWTQPERVLWDNVLLLLP